VTQPNDNRWQKTDKQNCGKCVYWRARFCVMWHCTIGSVAPDISKECRALLFKHATVQVDPRRSTHTHTLHSFNTSGTTDPATQGHNPVDLNHQRHCWNNIKSGMVRDCPVTPAQLEQYQVQRCGGGQEKTRQGMWHDYVHYTDSSSSSC